MTVPQNPLRQYRLAEELSLEALAILFGVNKTTVLRWEEGRIPAERVLEVERVTGVARHQLRPDLYLAIGAQPAWEKAPNRRPRLMGRTKNAGSRP